MRRFFAISLSVAVALCFAMPSHRQLLSRAALADGGATVRLPGHVLSALAGARPIAPADTKIAEANQPLLLTVILKRSDQPGFDRYLQDVYDSHSPAFHHFLTPEQVSDRFGPSRAAYEAVLSHLRSNGFRLVEGSSNRLTLTMRGTRVQAERAFAMQLKDFDLGGRRFFANDANPAVPITLAPYIEAIAGLSNLSVPRPASIAGAIVELYDTATIAELKALAASAPGRGIIIRGLGWVPESVLAWAQAWSAAKATISGAVVTTPGFGNPLVRQGDAPSIAPAGSGQKVGVLGFSSLRMSDVTDWLALVGLPAALVGQVSEVKVAGGAPLTAEQPEVLLGIETVLSIAPGAQVIVYDAPQAGPGAGFQALFNRMISDHVTVISNSFSYCEDQATFADVHSIDKVLATAAASGISVFNATGDRGSTCEDGSPDTVAVPADSPNATAVGGSSPTFGPGFDYGSEKWLDGSSQTPPGPQGGFGVSRFFSRPAYQDGFDASAMRSVPDVVASGDPRHGPGLCEADAGGCPTFLLYGGTSLSTPQWAAFAAILNQIARHSLGLLNPSLYPIAGSKAFHTAASMGSDAAHVGLGSPNGIFLSMKVAGLTPGAPDPSVSTLTPFPANPLVPFSGSVLADGATPLMIVAVLRDANGNLITGKNVTLTGSPGSHATIIPASSVTSLNNGAAEFSATDATVEDVTFTATDTTDGITLAQTVAVNFTGPPATAGGIEASPTTVTANGKNITTITVSLEANGKPAPGKVVGLSQGNGSSLVSGTNATTDSTGAVKFTATDTVVESVTYTAVDITDGNLPVPGSAKVSFVNASGPPPCNVGPGTAAPGFAVTTFAGGFQSNSSCDGPIGLAFDGNGNLLVGDYPTGVLYKFGPQGGIAGPGNEVGSTGLPANALAGLAFTADGRLYAADQAENKVVELDPSSAAVLRTVGTVLIATGVQVDPLSKDLFVSDPGFFCFDGPGIYRISDFSSASGHGKAVLSAGLRADLRRLCVRG